MAVVNTLRGQSVTLPPGLEQPESHRDQDRQCVVSWRGRQVAKALSSTHRCPVQYPVPCRLLHGNGLHETIRPYPNRQDGRTLQGQKSRPPGIAQVSVYCLPDDCNETRHPRSRAPCFTRFVRRGRTGRTNAGFSPSRHASRGACRSGSRWLWHCLAWWMIFCLSKRLSGT